MESETPEQVLPMRKRRRINDDVTLQDEQEFHKTLREDPNLIGKRLGRDWSQIVNKITVQTVDGRGYEDMVDPMDLNFLHEFMTIIDRMIPKRTPSPDEKKFSPGADLIIDEDSNNPGVYTVVVKFDRRTYFEQADLNLLDRITMHRKGKTIITIDPDGRHNYQCTLYGYRAAKPDLIETSIYVVTSHGLPAAVQVDVPASDPGGPARRHKIANDARKLLGGFMG